MPYGEWPSPLGADVVSSAHRKLLEVRAAPDGNTALFCESRPSEGGRYVVCRVAADGTKEEVSPAAHNVRTRVHEYGGGAWLVVPGADAMLVYSNFGDQELYTLPLRPDGAPGGEARALTSTGIGVRYADGVLYDAPGGACRYMICVRETHAGESAADVENEVVAVALDGAARGEETVLLRGSDFYACPTVSPDGRLLACVAWRHPCMPWDETQLLALDLPAALPRDPPAAPPAPTVLLDGTAGGAEAGASVSQPQFSPDGSLYFMSDLSSPECGERFYALHRLPAAQLGPAAPQAPQAPQAVLRSGAADMVPAGSLWMLGVRTYGFLRDGTLLCICPSGGGDGAQSLAMALPEVLSSGDPRCAAGREGVRFFGAREGLPDALSQLHCCGDESLLLAGGGPTAPEGVHRWEPLLQLPAAELASTVDAADRVAAAYMPAPERLRFPTALPGGAEAIAYGYYYAPKHPNCTGESGTAPPLLVKAHGGPHGSAATGYRLDVAYWTSRGWAVLDVDYGGSFGYGRAYRQRLTLPAPAWGVVDLEDVARGAEHCVARGMAQGGRLAIEGGSAGGYTVLCALTFRDTFSAGCSMYGVCDLRALAASTHKFEACYLDRLVGRLPEDGEAYERRSPVHHAAGLSCPVLLLHGAEDRIVPPEQAKLCHEALLERGLPTAMVIFEGEQHGFRRRENIELALSGKLYFFSRVFGLQPPEDLGTPFAIENLPTEAA